MPHQFVPALGAVVDPTIEHQFVDDVRGGDTESDARVQDGSYFGLQVNEGQYIKRMTLVCTYHSIPRR